MLCLVIAEYLAELQIGQRTPSGHRICSRVTVTASQIQRILFLHEVQQLYSVSDRLESLAGRHFLVSEALITISESLRNMATLLEVLIATKMAPLSGLDPANA